jgi:hypothetical protein
MHAQRHKTEGRGVRVLRVLSSSSNKQESPIRSLRGFQRIRLRAGERREVKFVLSFDDLPKSVVDISVGGGQPLGNMPRVQGRF